MGDVQAEVDGERGGDGLADPAQPDARGDGFMTSADQPHVGHEGFAHQGDGYDLTGGEAAHLSAVSCQPQHGEGHDHGKRRGSRVDVAGI